MPATIRFHLDENSDPAIAKQLRRRGIDVTTSQESSLLRATDEQQLTFVNSECRVLFTQDADFLKIHASHAPHCGIIYCKKGTRSLGEIVRGLAFVWEIMEAEELRNRLEVTVHGF